MIDKVTTQFRSNLKELLCSECLKAYPVHEPFNTSPCCNATLICFYEPSFDKNLLQDRPWTLWRYSEMLPVRNPENIVSLGEGGTPLIQLKKPLKGLSSNIIVKDESLNPTGSFKARGMSVAISKAKESGIQKCIIPTAGNAGVAMAAYCSRAGIKATVVIPKITPRIFIDRCRLYGADVILVDGMIDECGKKARDLTIQGDFFDVSTLREPYRIEGKKIMGYEIAEAMNWDLPDVIVYPTGGGTGLIGIWKAFNEMRNLGWISGPLPKMVSVQTDKCSPVVDTWNQKTNMTYTPSIALGLNVPKPFGMNLIIKTLSESEGTAISVTEEQIKSAQQEYFQNDGMVISPEGGSAYAGILKLVDSGFIEYSDRVLMLNTGGIHCGQS